MQFAICSAVQSLIPEKVMDGVASSSLNFCVRRNEPVLVTPAEPTPHEFKLLSDIDDQHGLRLKLSSIHFFRHCSPSSSVVGRDPAKLIKEALAKALVFYYPFAGRLREASNGKLLVECNAEGITFVEADADVRLQDFGPLPRPPFPCQKQLIYDGSPGGGIIGGSLLLIQVTRMKCGGFILAFCCNHIMADGFGAHQFLNAFTEMARGLDAPTIQPVWARHLLTATSTDFAHTVPQIQMQPTKEESEEEDLVHQYFFFRPKDISHLKSRIAPRLGTCSRFEALMALTWKCRCIALYSDHVPDEQVCAAFPVNGRGSKSSPTLPEGYYGNAIALAVAFSTTAELSSQPLDYAVELVREAKNRASLADLLLVPPAKGKPRVVTLADLNVPFRVGRSYLVSDVTKTSFNELDFGWGKPVYSSPAVLATWSPSGGHGKFVRCWKGMGLDGVLVPMCLPRKAMEKFVREMQTVIKVPTVEEEIESCLPCSKL